MFAVVAAAAAASPEVGSVSVSVSAPAAEPLTAGLCAGGGCAFALCPCCQRLLCSSWGAFVPILVMGRAGWLEMGMEGWKINRTCGHVQSHLLNGN